MSRSVDIVVDVLGYFVGEPVEGLEVSSTRSPQRDISSQSG